MTAAVDAELDAETVAEIESVASCDWHGEISGPVESCDHAPTYSIRFQLRCGHDGLMLMCTPHTRRVLALVHAWRCQLCEVTGQPRAVHWYPL